MESLTPKLLENAKIPYQDDKEKVAFFIVKGNLAKPTMLGYLDTTVPISISIDASNAVLWKVLQRREDETWRALAFFEIVAVH